MLEGVSQCLEPVLRISTTQPLTRTGCPMCQVSISTEVLVETQVAKKVRRLSKHASRKISAAAQALIDTWKKAVAAEGPAKPAAISEVPKDAPDGAQPDATNGGAAAKSMGSATDAGEELVEPPSPSGAAAETPMSRAVSREEVEAALAGVKEIGVELRDKLRGNIVEALMMAQVDARTCACDAVAVGTAVENELHTQFAKNSRDMSLYKAKYRSIHFNLKDKNNPDLRNRLATLHASWSPLVLHLLLSRETDNLRSFCCSSVKLPRTQLWRKVGRRLAALTLSL